MKLRNKKTGEVCEFMVHKRIENSKDGNPVYAPFTDSVEDWEDYDEPKMYWYIADNGEIKHDTDDNDKVDIFSKAIGNYFETKEEAKNAVEKLKAWKRLRNKGFEFEDYYLGLGGNFTIKFDTGLGCDDKDLDLLFGGEE